MPKLPETLTISELEDAIENHDCKLDSGACECTLLQKMLIKRRGWETNRSYHLNELKI